MRFQITWVSLILGSFVFSAGAQPGEDPAWHFRDFPGRNAAMWDVITEDLKTSFPEESQIPVHVEPFVQHISHLHSLKSLGIKNVDKLWPASEGAVGVSASRGAYVVTRNGEVKDADHSLKPTEVPMGGSVYSIQGNVLQVDSGEGAVPVMAFGRDGLPDDEVRDIASSPEGELYVATASGIGILSKEGDWRHLTGKKGGLPVNDSTALSFNSKQGLWVGTAVGVAYRTPAGEWHYRMGPRWMHGDVVLDVLAVDGGVWVLTAESLTFIEERMMTLREKAAEYDRITQERHVRHGAVTGSHFREPGNFDSWYMSDNDNDGLWTSIYLGAKCFEYAVTKDPEVLKVAKRHFDFMHRLETINGIDGFLARSIRPSEYESGGHEEYNYNGGGEWHESTVEPGWQWKADTSSDELVGHYFVWALYHDHVAPDIPGEQDRVKALIRRVTNHIIDNDFNFVDVDGHPTRWGVYDPRLMDGDLLWIDQIHFNPLGVLQHLKIALTLCGDDKFMEAYEYLIDEHHYATKAMMAKEMLPNTPHAGVNHSDDEMAWPYYYHLSLYPDHREDVTWKYKYSAARSMRREGPEKSPFFIVPFAVGFPEWAPMEDAVDTMKDWPLDLRHWQARNSHRDDVLIEPILRHRGSGERTYLVEPVDFDERVPRKWNHDPYVADDGDPQGRREEDGGSWLLPYWMAVYHGFIEGPGA